MKKFHITITNNETAETFVDIDTSAIVGAIDEDGTTHLFCLTGCNGLTLAATLAGALQCANANTAQLPKSLQRKIKSLGKKFDKDYKTKK